MILIRAAEWLVWSACLLIVWRAWKTEIADRKRTNHEFAIVEKTNPDCLKYLQKVARVPTWRRHLLASCIMSLILCIASWNVRITTRLLLGLVVIFVGLQLPAEHHAWHILCHARCVM